jgi:soluble lytic murein transglycosylase
MLSFHTNRASRTISAAAARLALCLTLLLTACSAGEAPAPTPTATALPAPAQAPAAPAALLARALESRALGDYDAAATDAHALVEAAPDAPEARPARYYLAESYARRGRWASAIAALSAFLADGPADAFAAQARFWLARSYEATGEHGRAADEYGAYRALAAPLEPYAALRQADQLELLGRHEDAAALFEAVAGNDDLPRAERAGSLEGAIRARRALGQAQGVLALYARLLDMAEVPSYRAGLLASAAALADEAGDAASALAWRRELCAEHVGSVEAADAAPLLLAAGELAPADAARILFAAERHEAALPLFESAIAAATGDEALALRRQRALSLRAAAQWQPALDELAAVGAAAPDGEVGRQAQLDWAQTLGQSGATEQAIAAYREFAGAYAQDARAPEALRRVAELLERAGDAAGAVEQRLDLGRRFPKSEQAPAALHAAALARFQAGDWQGARDAWQLIVDAAAEPLERVRAAFWAGRAAQEAGDDAAAGALFAQARALAPESYYGERAAAVLDVDPPAPAVALDAPLAPGDWLALGGWVSDTFKLGAAPDGAAPPALASSGAITRALALEEVGLGEQAMDEWGAARAAADAEPAQLLAIARLAHERGLPAVALAAAQQLLAAAPAEAPQPPAALDRLRFPVPWPALVRASAAAEGLDPLLLLALIRQESKFDPTAVSSAGARGLAQIMPDTAHGIARQLGVAEFQLDALDAPATSVRFGAYYIAQQLRASDGSVPAALAAYNAGPGNSQSWSEAADPAADADLFVELIDFGETRAYVKLVDSYYQAYQRLYQL